MTRSSNPSPARRHAAFVAHRTVAQLALLLPPIVLSLVLLPTPPAAAQHGAAPATRTPPREAGQYNFLLGTWEVSVRVPPPSLAARLHGMPKLVGTWKAWRALGGWGIVDELQITDAAGNPISLSHSVRFYDAKARRWRLSTLDVYRGRFTSPTAEWRQGQMHSGQMHSRSAGIDAQGRAYTTRTRIYGITRDRFELQQDHSYDEGKSWEEDAVHIEARRVAATAPR